MALEKLKSIFGPGNQEFGFGDDLDDNGKEPSGGLTLSPKTNKSDDFYRQTFSTANPI